MSKKEFTINDLKSGYVVETRDGSRYLVTRVNQNNFIKVIVNTNRSFGIGCFNTDLTYVERSKKHDIVKVWGLSDNPLLAVCIDNVENRPLLWERQELLNCKICVTEDTRYRSLTKGKIYEISDGVFFDNENNKYPELNPLTDLDDLAEYFKSIKDRSGNRSGYFTENGIKYVVVVED